MRALVTGATGCLGRHLCLGLDHAGWHVTGVGRNQANGQWLSNHGIDFVRADLFDREKLSAAMADKDVVYHCAAYSSAWGRKDEFERSNVYGTELVLQTARTVGVKRLVFVSSTSVYFDYLDQFDISETHALPNTPVNHYAWSKREAEAVVRRSTDIEWVIIRPRGIIGSYDAALMPRLAKVARKGIVPLPNGGDALVDVTCVENLVQALIATGEADQAVDKQTYNISNGHPVRIRRLMELALQALDLKPKFVAVPRKPAMWVARVIEKLENVKADPAEPLVTPYSLGLLAYSQTLHIGKARQELNYRPSISLEEGISNVGKWWQHENRT